uniref:Uncharacterized protein n=1 Tax=Pristionchus pacificus TaxID=54126 RepID=A0A2A6C7Y7_PRIPA|eukprot:PDM74141.1 hypothetical protein PRIPAC_41497 [Pristionchus pacificus]
MVTRMIATVLLPPITVPSHLPAHFSTSLLPASTVAATMGAAPRRSSRRETANAYIVSLATSPTNEITEISNHQPRR